MERCEECDWEGLTEDLTCLCTLGATWLLQNSRGQVMVFLGLMKGYPKVFIE